MFKCCCPTIKMNYDGVNNRFVDKLMKEISWSFIGTYSADDISIFSSKNKSVVVYLDKVGKKGHIIWR